MFSGGFPLQHITANSQKRPVYRRLHILNIFLLIFFFLCLIPVAVASRYIMAQADDFTYSTRTHLAWSQTHSVLVLLQAIASQIYHAYTDWQGTFTSTILMSLQPSIFGEQFYHIVPLLIIGIFSLSTWFFIRTVLHSILKVSTTLANGLSILVILISVENIRQPAEAFTWYNSAIHYTGIHSLWLLTAAMVLRYLFLENKTRSRHIAMTVFVCFLSFMCGGGNNLSALEALVLEFVFGFFLILWGHDRYRVQIRRFVLCFGFLLAGAMCNFLCPGNSKRMGADSHATGIAETILKCFYAGGKLGTDWIDLSFIIFILWTIPYILLIVRELVRRQYRFRMPLLVLFAMYGCFSAMWAPNIYVMDLGGLDMKRTQNVGYYHYILLLCAGLIYVAGWAASLKKGRFLQKLERFYDGSGRVRTVRWIYYPLIVLMSIGCIGLINRGAPMHYTSSAALHSIAYGGGQKWLDTINGNLEIIRNSPDDVVIYCAPVDTEEAFIRTPSHENEMSPWRDGVGPYYGKLIVVYYGTEVDAEKVKKEQTDPTLLPAYWDR